MSEYKRTRYVEGFEDEMGKILNELVTECNKVSHFDGVRNLVSRACLKMNRKAKPYRLKKKYNFARNREGEFNRNFTLGYGSSADVESFSADGASKYSVSVSPLKTGVLFCFFSQAFPGQIQGFQRTEGNTINL